MRVTRHDFVFQHFEGILLFGGFARKTQVRLSESEHGPLDGGPESLPPADCGQVAINRLPEMRTKILEINDIKFSKDGRILASRDFFNAYIWDLRSVREPLIVRGASPA